MTIANALGGNMTRLRLSVQLRLLQHNDRDAIGQGEHELRDNSVSFDNKDFCQLRRHTQSLAMTPLVSS